VHPAGGVSAITIASLAIADLTQNGWHGLIVKGRKTGTSNVGVIAGGEATNVVTPRLHLRAEVRSHDPQFRQKIVAEFRKAFTAAAKSVRNDAGQAGRITFQADLKYESFRLNEDDPSMLAAKEAVTALGLAPQTRISNGGLDANWMTAHGLPTVTLGCGQSQIHTVNEILDVPSYLQACRIGLLLATGGRAQ
jgi:tripeptide aminopeptidase